MGKIIWSLQAVDDLTNIAEYCSSLSDNYASSIITKLFKKVQILKTMPRVGRVVPEKNDEKVRELVEGNYRIIYEIEEKGDIEILLVHHSSRPLINI